MNRKDYQKPTMQVVKIQKRAFLLNSDPKPGTGEAPKFFGDLDEEM